MLSILNKEEVEKFIESLNQENDEDYYCEKVKYLNKCKYIGWSMNKEVKCIAVITKMNNKNKYQFMSEINEKIVNVLVDLEKNHNHVKDLIWNISKEFPNTALESNDSIARSNYQECYSLLNIQDPYKDNDYDNFSIYIEDKIMISKFNNTDFQSKFEVQNEEIEIESLEYKMFSQEELREFMMTDGYWNNHLVGDYSTFSGFYYFSSKNLSSYLAPENLRFLVCIANKNNVIGVLKIADYKNDDLLYTGLNYVDVHAGYRRKGIAKEMYKHLNENLGKDTLLISSYLSDMGVETKIDLMRKECLTNFKNFNSLKDYYESTI